MARDVLVDEGAASSGCFSASFGARLCACSLLAEGRLPRFVVVSTSRRKLLGLLALLLVVLGLSPPGSGGEAEGKPNPKPLLAPWEAEDPWHWLPGPPAPRAMTGLMWLVARVF